MIILERYAVFGKVQPNDVATLTTPIFERTDKVQIQGKEYTLIREGNDVVHIDPPGKYCPLHQRRSTARTKRGPRRSRVSWPNNNSIGESRGACDMTD